MKKALKVLLILVAVVVLVAVAAASYVAWFLPNVGKSEDLKVEITPERLKRGEYLATSVAVCVDCHSTRDWSQFAGPPTPGTFGKGGDKFGKEAGFPGEFYAKNITPAGLKNWTDGELFRVITTGVNKHGKAMFPVMPYINYGKMDKEDVYSIIAYIRSLPAIENNPPASKADFPFSLIMNTIPQKAQLTKMPDLADSVAYGAYLVNVASCGDCHTKFEKGEFVKGTEFGGGREFQFPGGIVRSANITPHETGIGYWTRERFIKKFKDYQDTAYQSPKLDFMKDFNSPMPWMMYSKMTESDLSSIYQYLKTVKPIDGVQPKFTPYH